MWFFTSPQIVFGEDALSWLSQMQGKRAFIVTDENMVKLGFVQRVQEQLALAGIDSAFFADVEPDPCLETVRRCAGLVSEWAPDWVIGLGGGSCLDAAKAAWFMYERPDVELEAINPMEAFNLRARSRLATIPTTSGTGSDVSWGFALADPEGQCKVVRVSRELVPDLAIVDPGLVVGLPPLITADTGMDVLAHAIEGYTSNFHNDFSDGLCLTAIKLVFEYLPRAYADGGDLEAREHMHNAATIAGLGFSNSAIILAHTLAHAVGGTFKTPHGRTVGMFLPYTIEYIARTHPERYAAIASHLRLPFSGEVEGAAKLVEAVRHLGRQVGQPACLEEMGISFEAYREALPHLISTAISSPDILESPRFPYDVDLERLFLYAYDGKAVDF